MKILQVTDTLDPGGAERVAVDLANSLCQRNISVYFCTTRREGSLRRELNEKITFVCLHRKGRWDGILKFRRYVLDNKIEVVHAHGNSSAFFCIAALLLSNVKVIHHDHNPVLLQRNLFLEKIILKRCDLWIAVSTIIRDWATKTVGARNVILLINPVDLSKFPENAKNVSTSLFRGVVLANYRTQKAHLNLIKAINYIQSPIFIDCYGAHYASDVRKVADALIQEYKIENRISLHDSIAQVATVLYDADAGILSSDQEGLPISLLEYMASGLPVAVTDVGECGTLVRSAECGYVVAPGDPEALAGALKDLLADREGAVAMGKKGRAYVQRYHSLERFTDEVIGEVEKL